eukprot:4939457-Amphidinium_carterae.2
MSRHRHVAPLFCHAAQEGDNVLTVAALNGRPHPGPHKSYLRERWAGQLQACNTPKAAQHMERMRTCQSNQCTTLCRSSRDPQRCKTLLHCDPLQDNGFSAVTYCGLIVFPSKEPAAH